MTKRSADKDLKDILSAFMQVKPEPKKAATKENNNRGRKGKRRKGSKDNG